MIHQSGPIVIHVDQPGPVIRHQKAFAAGSRCLILVWSLPSSVSPLPWLRMQLAPNSHRQKEPRQSPSSAKFCFLFQNVRTKPRQAVLSLRLAADRRLVFCPTISFPGVSAGVGLRHPQDVSMEVVSFDSLPFPSL